MKTTTAHQVKSLQELDIFVTAQKEVVLSTHDNAMTFDLDVAIELLYQLAGTISELEKKEYGEDAHSHSCLAGFEQHLPVRLLDS